MPLIKVEEIKVIGNVIENQQRYRRSKLLHLNSKVDKQNPICPVCSELMVSPLGMYNGACGCDGDDEDCYRIWEFECSNFHNANWTEEC